MCVGVGGWRLEYKNFIFPSLYKIPRPPKRARLLLSQPARGIVSLIASRHVAKGAGPRRAAGVDLKSAKHWTKFARQMDHLETSGRPNESAGATSTLRCCRDLFKIADASWKVDPPLIVFTESD